MKKRNYDPGTITSRRRPAPTEFAHLRKWRKERKRSIRITNTTNLKNINQQLEQNAELYLSNIISRVIAQLIGAYGDGFVTLEATAAGALKVATVGSGHTVLNKVINVSGAGPHEIIAAVAGKKIKITNIMFTVSGDVDVIFYSDATPISGTLLFGGADEPRGMVHHFGDHPLETVAGKPFKIGGSAGIDIDGYVTYFTE